MLYPPPIQCQKLLDRPLSRKPLNQKKKLHIFYTFLPILGSKFKIPIATEIWQIFRHLENWHLMAQQMA